jgi:hypothetical protein
MMLTKKDYVKLANMLKHNFDNAAGEKQRQTVVAITNDLIVILADNNPRFDSDRFREAIFMETRL